MKIKIYNNYYSIFINKSYSDKLDYDDKDEVIDFVKNIIIKFKNKLKLSGLYRVKVYLNKIVGIYIDILQIDKCEFSSSLDLRVIIYGDENFYFETDDYFIISKFDDIRIYNDKYYCLVNNKMFNILDYIEFGRVIYGDEVNNLLSNSKILC